MGGGILVYRNLFSQSFPPPIQVSQRQIQKQAPKETQPQAKRDVEYSDKEYKREKLFSFSDYFPDLPAYSYDAIDTDLRFSPDGKHFAIYTRHDSLSDKSKPIQSILILDGKIIGTYDKVSGDAVEPLVKFSPDSNEIAYVVQTGEKSFVVQNNQPGKQYQEAGYEYGDSGIARTFFEFSPDGKHLAYRVFDGQEEYFIKAKGSFFIVFDGKEGKHYDDIVSGIVFSPDSKHFAYVANEGCVFEFIGYTGDRGNCYGGKSFIVKDGMEQPERHDFINSLKFSPDGELVYAGSDGCPYAGGQAEGCVSEQKYFIVFHGKKMETNGGVDVSEISSERELADFDSFWAGLNMQYISDIPFWKFSPDGNHFAYVVRPKDGKNYFVVLDGREKKGYYDGIWDPLFSPDSKHFVYIGRLSHEGRRYAGSSVYEGLQIVVVDDQPLKSPDGMDYARIKNLHFSEDGSSIFYNARSGDSWYYVTESVE